MLEVDGETFEEHFETNQDSKDILFTFANPQNVLKTLKEKEVSLTLKKKKLLFYKTNLDSGVIKLNSLGSKSVVQKSVTLNNVPIPVTVTVRQSLRVKEMELTKKTKRILGPVPPPFKTAEELQAKQSVQASPAGG